MRWQSLIRYADSGHLLIDNTTPSKTPFSPSRPARKLTAQVPNVREKRATAIQTLLGTAKLNGLNPAQWLEEVLKKFFRIAYSQIDELLPLIPEATEALLKESG